MAKITLGKNQIENLLRALDIAEGTFHGVDEPDFRKELKTFETLRASIEKQLGLNAGEPYGA
jgi:hypothetical protein